MEKSEWEISLFMRYLYTSGVKFGIGVSYEKYMWSTHFSVPSDLAVR